MKERVKEVTTWKPGRRRGDKNKAKGENAWKQIEGLRVGNTFCE